LEREYPHNIWPKIWYFKTYLHVLDPGDLPLIERLKLIIVVIVSCGLSLLDLLLLHHCPHIGDMHAVADAAMWIFEVLPSDPLKPTRFNQFRTFKESLVLTHDAGNDPGQVNHDASLGSLVSRDTWGSTSRYRTDPSRCPKKCHFDGAKRVHI